MEQSVSTFRFFRAPGRVNLIGEHTDYNEGFVLPTAIAQSCWVAMRPRPDQMMVARALNLGETLEAPLASLPGPRSNWQDYVVGVARELIAAGARAAGVDLWIWSDVPLGAGVSSSAALEVSIALALAAAWDHAMTPLETAHVAHRAEVNFVGLACGLMDQFAACFSREGCALLLDCRTNESRAVRLPANASLVLANTMMRHDLAASAYNDRRRECEAAAASLGLRSLRDATIAQAASVLGVPGARARHIVSENARVSEFAEALESGDLHQAGALMRRSHESLRDDYAVSCRELDVMVDLALNLPGCFGSRMTGGGFGGCTISLVERDAVDSFRLALASGYRAATGVAPDVWVVETGSAAGEAA